MTENIILKDESYQIVGACFEVYNEMGCGFLETVYQECLDLEFGQLNLPFAAHKELNLSYKRKPLKCKYIPDFICFDQIILEIKALGDLTNQHRAQVQNYLKASGFKLGLLVNFGQHPKLQYERIVR